MENKRYTLEVSGTIEVMGETPQEALAKGKELIRLNPKSVIAKVEHYYTTGEEIRYVTDLVRVRDF